MNRLGRWSICAAFSMNCRRVEPFDIVAAMNRSLSSGLFFVLAGLLVAGCGKEKGPEIAKVGSISVGTEEFRQRLENMPPAFQQYVASADGRRQYLNLLIREKVLAQEAKREGMDKEPAYRAAVKEFRINQKRQEREYATTLLIEAFMRKLRSKDLAVTDADVRSFYDSHKDEFEKPIEINANHILVTSEIEANTVLDRLKKGEAFDKLAREFSKDPASASRGGKLKAFRRGHLVPEFEEVAFKMKDGETSGLVKSQFGFHIIRKSSQTQLPPRSYESAKEEIRMRLERERFDQWVTAKQKQLGTVVDEKAMAAFTPTPSSQELPLP